MIGLLGMVDSCDSSGLLTHYTQYERSLDMLFSVTFKGKQGKSVVLPFIVISSECFLPFVCVLILS